MNYLKKEMSLTMCEIGTLKMSSMFLGVFLAGAHCKSKKHSSIVFLILSLLFAVPSIKKGITFFKEECNCGCKKEDEDKQEEKEKK